MKLIQLLYYMENYIPVRIATENNGIEIICFTEEIEKLLKDKEKETNLENLKRAILNMEVIKIDYDGEQERIEIIIDY